MVFFDNVPLAPVDPIFGVALAFAADHRPEKINLGVGTYRGENLAPYVLPVVKKAERLLLESEPHKEYLPIDGERAYVETITALVLGGATDEVATLQTVGGTGGLRLAATFLKERGFKEIFLPDPTWDNHKRIFSHAGLKVSTYPYYNKERKSFDFAAMMRALFHMPKGSIVMLQACCHNPTGFDPTFEEWKEIADAMSRHELLPFFDFAYQGFGEGISEDAAVIRYFASRGIESVIVSSCSKNFGLYAERVGALFVVGGAFRNVLSQLKVVVRGLYSNPPCHGVRIVSTILESPELRQEWEKEVGEMRTRISQMRAQLVKELLKLGREEFAFLAHQKGMFSYTGLSPQAVERLTREEAIYLPADGRINVAGINRANCQKIAEAIARVSVT